jgi:hypothetical protein
MSFYGNGIAKRKGIELFVLEAEEGLDSLNVVFAAIFFFVVVIIS